jgi:TatD DNase family protein
MYFVDTHAHLYLNAFHQDQDEMLQRAFDQKVEYIFLPNIDSESIQDMLELESKYPNNVMAMMGLHPCSVKPETMKKELLLVENWLSNRHFHGLGEIGMDLYWDQSTLKEQTEAFKIQARWAMELQIPIVVHSRDALDPLIKLVDELQDGILSGIFHCFSGDENQAKQILDLGFYLGIGGPLTYKKSTMPDVFRDIPMNRIVLETDSPYLPPIPHRGQRNESAYIPLVAQKLAEIKQIGIEEIARLTSENAFEVYKFKGDLI